MCSKGTHGWLRLRGVDPHGLDEIVPPYGRCWNPSMNWSPSGLPQWVPHSPPSLWQQGAGQPLCSRGGNVQYTWNCLAPGWKHKVFLLLLFLSSSPPVCSPPGVLPAPPGVSSCGEPVPHFAAKRTAQALLPAGWIQRAQGTQMGFTGKCFS